MPKKQITWHTNVILTELKKQYGKCFINTLYNLINLEKKIINCKMSIEFLRSCLKAKVIPTCAKIKSGIVGFNKSQLQRKLCCTIMRFGIRQTRKTINAHLPKSRSIWYNLVRSTYSEDMNWINEFVNNKLRKHKILIIQRHEAKLSQLSRYNLRQTNHDKNFINISSRILTDTEEDLLNRGPEFIPTHIPSLCEMRCDAEVMLSNLPNESFGTVITYETMCRRQAKLLPSTMSKPERVAMKNLMRDEDITICKSDKGRALAVVNTKDYVEHGNLLLTSNKFVKLSADPTAKREKTFNQFLLKLHKEGKLSKQQYNEARSTGASAGYLYLLPKLHKPTLAFRPIIASYMCFGHKLAKMISKILNVCKSHSFSRIKDGPEFAKYIKSFNANTCFFATADVNSLFTNVPLRSSVQIAAKVLSDKCDNPILNISEWTELLMWCTEKSAFLFENDVFDQIDGVAMGSPLGPTLANIYMDEWETDIYHRLPDLCAYWRYVDDVFMVFNTRPNTVSLRNVLNEKDPAIQWHVQFEDSKQSIAFLDVLVRRGNNITTEVYRKPNITWNPPLWSTHIPNKYKISAASSLLLRSLQICSEKCTRLTESSIIKSKLKNRGFPKWAITQADRKSKNIFFASTHDKKDQAKTKIYLRSSFVDNRSLNKLEDGLRRQTSRPTIYCPPSRCLASMFKRRPLSQKTLGLVYEIKCKDCEATYVGQTKRPLHLRIKEHRNALRKGDMSSAVLNHSVMKRHNIEFDNIKILAKESNYYRRIIFESIHINGSGERMHGNKSNYNLKIPIDTMD